MEKKLYDLTVNEKFRSLCPPLREAERVMLEESILAKGCEMPLIVWAGKDILVDGHNRYSICREHGIPFAITEESFETEDDVMYWIVMNQIGRRNLNTYSKIEMVLPLTDILEQGAMQRMLSGRKQDAGAGSELSQGKGRVSEHIAAMVGSSSTVVKQVKKIVNATDDVYRKLGPVRYSTMMVLVRKAWNGEAWSVSQNMLRGMAEFYCTYEDCFKVARFMTNLQGVPRTMLERAVGKYYGMSPRISYALALASFYNKKGGVGTLDMTRLTVRG